MFTQLKATFLSKQSACFVLEYVSGITLYQYQREFLMIPLHIVRYCAAVSLEMLATLHAQHLIFRDLKPENLMIESKTGALVLVDFGFTKDINQQGRTFTKCGSPGYSAPEILQQADSESYDQYDTQLRQNSSLGYSFPSDVWSWGVLVCELVGGYNPFSYEAKSVLETFTNILNCKINWPKNMPAQLQSLLKRVFERDQQQRITIAEIKKHSFFEGVNFGNLRKTFTAEVAEIKLKTQDIVNRRND